MADAYRGLTIEFGGDATKLTKVLSTVNKAAKTTQSNLSQINKAMKLDPGNASLVAMKFEELSNAEEDAHASLLRVKDGLRQMRAEGVDRLAEKWKNSSLEAEKARERFARVNTELRDINDELKRITGFSGDELANLFRRGEMSALALTEQESKLLAMHRKLSHEHNVIQGDLEELGKVEAFERLRRDEQQAIATSKALREELLGIKMSQTGVSRDVEALGKRLKTSEKAAESLRHEFDRLDQALNLDPSNIEVIRLGMRNLKEQAELSAEKADELRRAMTRLADGRDIDELTSDMRKLTAEEEEAAEGFKELYRKVQGANSTFREAKQQVQLLREQLQAVGMTDEQVAKVKAEIQRVASEGRKAKTEAKELEERLRAAGRALNGSQVGSILRTWQTEAAAASASAAGLMANSKKFGSVQEKVLSSARTAGYGLYSTITPALMMLGTSFIDAADDMDTAYRKMRKTTEGTEAQYEALRNFAVEYSETHATAASTMLEIMSLGGQMGVAVENLEDFSKVVSNLEISTDMDADTIALRLGQFANVMGLASSEYDNYGDAVTRLGNKLAAQESTITETAAYLQGTAKAYGFSADEVLGWSGAMAATGLSAEEAGDAMSRILQVMALTVSEGGDDLEQLAGYVGMTGDEFKTAFKDNASDVLLSLMHGIADAKEGGKDLIAILQELEIKKGMQGTQNTDVMTRLVNNVGLIEKALSEAEVGWNVGGDAEREAMEMTLGFSGALKDLENSFDNLGSSVGESFVPVIRSLAELMTDVRERFEAMPAWQQQAAVAFLGVAAVAGPVVVAFTSVWDAMSKLGGLLDAASGKFGKVGQAINKFRTPAVLAAAAVAAVAVALKSMYDEAHKYDAVGTRISEALGIVAEGSDNARAKTEALSKVYRDSKKDVEDYLESYEKTAEAIEGRHSEASANNSKIAMWGDMIAELSGKSDLSKAELMQLKVAVDEVNEACGTSYQVVEDGMGGAYVALADGAAAAADEIQRVIDNHLALTMLDVYEQDYRDIVEQQVGAADAQAKAQADLIKATQDYNEQLRAGEEMSTWGGDNSAAIDRAAIAMNEAQREFDAVTASMDELTAASDTVIDKMAALQAVADGSADHAMSFVATNMALSSALGISSVSVNDFAEALRVAGGNTDLLAELSAADWVTILTAFQEGSGDLVSTLTTMNEELASTMSEGSLEAVGAYVESISQSATDAAEAAQEVSDATTEAMEGAEEAAASADETASSYVDEVGEWTDDAETEGASVAQSAVDGLDSVDATLSGVNLIQGFINGMESMRGAVYATAQSIGSESAVGGVDNGAGNASPSKKTFKSGRFIDMGLIDGMEDMAADVERAGRMVGQIPVDAIDSYADYAHDAAASVNKATIRRNAAAMSAAVSKQDLYDVVHSAFEGNAVEMSASVYIDSRQLAAATSRAYDTELGSLTIRKGR